MIFALVTFTSYLKEAMPAFARLELYEGTAPNYQ